MVAVVVTASIHRVLSSANLLHKIETTRTVSTVPHKELCDALSRLDTSSSLSTLLSTTELHLSHADAVSKHSPPSRDPVLEARVSRLRARLDDAHYAHITRDVARASPSNAQVEDLRMAKFAPQLSLGLNVVVTMATCFVAGYFVVKNSTGNQTYGLVGGVAGLILAMVIEAVLLLTRMYSIDAAVDKQVKKRQSRAERGATAAQS